MKRIVSLLSNFLVDVFISYFAGVIGSAVYATVSGTQIEGTIFLQFVITLIALQLFRFVQYVKGKL